MQGMNKAILVGNVCSDPELRYSGTGTAVLNVRVATNERYKSGDEWKERADFHSVVIWGGRGESLKDILRKGSQVLIEGRIQTSSFEDKESGQKRYKTEINVNEVILLGKRPESTSDSDDN